jgi:HlyD family secretion protein
MAGTLQAQAGNPALRKRKLLLGLGGSSILGISVLGVWLFMGHNAGSTATTGETGRVVRDKLVVTATESAEISTKRSVDIRCKVEGQVKVIWVIVEGTVVKQGDKLMELDSAELKERFRTQDITYKNAQATADKAEKDCEIAQSSRESQLSTAGLTVKFALMDLRKYLGTDLADELMKADGKVKFEELAKHAKLGGEALQEERRLQSAIDMASEDLARAKSKAEWTKTLKEKGYVTGSELEADEQAARRQEVAVEQAKTALDLFLAYVFPKMAEKSFSDWREAGREYDRVDARSANAVSSAKSEAAARKDALTIEETRYKKAKEQIEMCTVLAPSAGMVIYNENMEWMGQGQGQGQGMVGSTVSHQQVLLKLPDMSEMVAKTKLNESIVKQVKMGATSFATTEAFPDLRLTGTVTKIAMMPDRSNMWLNPGLKAYETEITLEKVPPGLKPGMSAQVEVLIDTRPDVLQVPIAAIYVEKGFQVVYVKTTAGPEIRRVEVGLSSNQAVEIKKGVTEGEEVYLCKPAGAPELQLTEEEMKAREQAEEKAPPAKGKAAGGPSAGGGAAL